MTLERLDAITGIAYSGSPRPGTYTFTGILAYRDVFTPARLAVKHITSGEEEDTDQHKEISFHAVNIV